MANGETPQSLALACSTPGCGKRLKVAAEMAGKKVRCPQCRQVIAVPSVPNSTVLGVQMDLPAAPAPAPAPARSANPAPATHARAADATAERKFRRVDGWIAWCTQPKPQVRTAIRLSLAVSFFVHLAIAPLAPHGGDSEALQIQETEYMKKTAAAKNAGVVAKQVSNRITTPPPPPDPEGIVTNTLNQALTTDIEKVVGKLLDVSVTSKLTQQVTASLKDELAAAAKNITAGNMTEEQIRELHEKFKRKANDTAVAALKEHRIETQVQTATMNTTDWYENSVSRTLFTNLRYELFQRAYGQLRWHEIYSKYMGDIVSDGPYSATSANFSNRVDLISHMMAGRRVYDQKPDASWPGPNKEQAQFLLSRMKELYEGTDKRYAHNYGPEQSWEAVCKNFIRVYKPHQEEAALEIYKKTDELWKKALEQAEAYVHKAESNADPADLKNTQGNCIATSQEIIKTAQSMGAKHGWQTLYNLNRQIRTEVIEANKDKMYTHWVDEMVKGFEPVIKNFAKGQFKKGILVHKDGVDEAMKQFPTLIVPLLRRDVQKLIPQKTFNELIYTPYAHKSKVTGEGCPPSDKEIKEEQAALAAWADKEYLDKRREIITKRFTDLVPKVKEDMLTAVLTGGLLLQNMSAFVEGVDYADKVQERLDARASALAGRGQDLAKLTADGVPDTSAALFTLFFNSSKGAGVNLEPVLTELAPEYATRGHPLEALRAAAPKLPPPPMKWGFETQAEIKAPFKSARVEGIPFLSKFPKLDGDLSDWGKVRPLFMQGPKGQDPVAVYAAWNYQGFFFGYRVNQAAEKFYYPSQWGQSFNHNTGDVGYTKMAGSDWAYKGDYLRLMFDTLDARNQNRGEPHTQEFIVFPRGTDSDPDLPGIERVFESQRDAKSKEYRGAKAGCKVFLQQPPPEQGPDGTGPYRVSKVMPEGYSVEVFIPRALFNVPVFAPGWYMGFDCAVATGFQQASHTRFVGYPWASGDVNGGPERTGLNPSSWGDLMLLGTDPRLIVQEADEEGKPATGVVPGHSYLLTIIDPDRNVYPTLEDTVIISAEVKGGANDVEVYILKETEKNSGIFRGYVNTQPGSGREVHKVLEVSAGQELRFGYVDFANSRGERSVISELKLPVVSCMMNIASKQNKPAE